MFKNINNILSNTFSIIYQKLSKFLKMQVRIIIFFRLNIIIIVDFLYINQEKLTNK